MMFQIIKLRATATSSLFLKGSLLQARLRPSLPSSSSQESLPPPPGGDGDIGVGISGGNDTFTPYPYDSLDDDSDSSLPADSSSSSSINQDGDLPLINQTQPSSSYQFKRLLSYGVKGNDVSELQKRLTSEKVYKGPITGYFGKLTKEAVKKYQAKNKLPQVGAVGPKTLALLNKTSSIASPQGFSLR